MKILPLIAAFCSLFTTFIPAAFAQGTTFTYQGRLNSGGNPANGSYDVMFTLYDSNNVPANVIAGPITNSATLVSNGLFTTTLDFGNPLDTHGFYAYASGAWLGIAVRTNGGTGFSTLAPRQQLTATPRAVDAERAAYADQAGSATTANSAVPVPGSGYYVQNQNGSAQAANSWISGTAKAGNFIGDGSGLTHVPPSASSEPGSPSAGQLYFDTTLNGLRFYDGTAWRTLAVAGNPSLQQQQSQGAVANGNSLSLSGFTTFPTVTVWVLASGTAYINVAGNASYPVSYDSGSKFLTVTNNSGSTKSMVITAVGQ